MARLPEASMNKLTPIAANFRTFAKIDGFSYKSFENKAEEFEKNHPGEGYQMAYYYNITKMFKHLFENHVNRVDNALSLDDFVKYYDNFIMKSYIDERTAQGLETKIELNGDKIRLETVEWFKEVLDKKPDTTVYASIKPHFDDGRINADNTYALAKKKKDLIPTKKEALNLVAYAEAIDEQNKKRPMWQKIFTFWVHFKERSAINALRNLAVKSGISLDDLRDEAINEPASLKQLREDVNTPIILAMAANKEMFKEVANEINSVEVLGEVENENLVETDDRYFIVGGNGKNNDLDQSIDLGGDVEENVIGDDAEGAKDFFGEDISPIEKVEFVDDEIDIFSKNTEAKDTSIKDPVKENQITK